VRNETRNFAAPFQWEVDRLVFRHRPRGDPVEVDEEERDRLIERFRERSRAAGRGMFAALFGSAFLYSIFAQWIENPLLLLVPTYGGVMISTVLLHRWAFDSPTEHLRKRPVIGERLGPTGGYLRAIAAVPARNIWGGLLYLFFVGWLSAAAFAKKEGGTVSIAMFGIVGALLLLALLAKGALASRDRLRRRDGRLLHRARSLRAD
jgi:hypothetical protein